MDREAQDTRPAVFDNSTPPTTPFFEDRYDISLTVPKLIDDQLPEDVEFYEKPVGVAKALRQLGNECCLRSKQVTCECGQENQKPWSFCSNKLGCPICNRAYTASRGRAMFEKLYRMPARYYGHVTLTFPKDYFGWEEGEKEEVENQIFALVKKFMARSFKDVFGYIVRVHSWNSREPLSDPHFHVHILIPLIWIAEKELVLFPFNPFLPVEVLYWFRENWSEVIGVEETELANPDWKYISREQPEKLLHRCNYLCRGAILDVQKFLERENVEELSVECQEWLLYHTGYKKFHRRIRSFGQVSDSRIGYWLENYGSSRQEIKEVLREEKQASKKVYCRCCHRELTEKFKYSFRVVDTDPGKQALRRRVRLEKLPLPAKTGRAVKLLGKMEVSQT